MAGKKITDLTTESELSDQHYIITQNYIITDETKKTPLSLLKTFLSIVGKKESTNSTAERFNHYTFSDSSFTAGDYAHSEGWGTKASGDYAHSEGLDTQASGSDSHSEGHNTVASGFASHAEGDGTKATGVYSHSEGNGTEADYVGHSEGWYTKATNTSHSEGNYTEATGYTSHAEGNYTKATGEASHASGYNTIAAGTAQTAIGKYNVEDTSSLFIIGCGTYNERKNALLVDADGNLKVLGSISADGGFEGIESGGSISMWTAETTYAVDDVVINDTTIYKCTTEHTSGTEFDLINWTALTGEQGESGITPHIDETTKHWFIGETDTGVVAEGQDGISPTVSVTQTETGATITVVSGETTTTANLINGVTPEIDESTKHWIVNGEDTGVVAEGTTTVTTSAIVYNGTLLVENWIGDTVPYTQTVTIEGIDETSRPYLYPVLSDDVVTGLTEQKEWGYITKAVTSTDSIVFSCYKTKPTIDINFEAEVR